MTTNPLPKRNTSTPKLSDFAALRENALSPLNTTSRDPSPMSRDSKSRIGAGPAKVSREPPIQRTTSATSMSRLDQLITAANKSAPNVTQTARNTVQPVSPRPQRHLPSSVPHWPTSPRLSLSRSPPPMTRSPSLTSPRKTSDATQYPSYLSLNASSEDNNSGDGSATQHPPRTPRLGSTPAPTLETVTESSLPSTPAIGLSRKVLEHAMQTMSPQAMKPDAVRAFTNISNAHKSSSSTTTAELSESDTGNKSDEFKPPSRAPSRALQRRPTVGSSTVKQPEGTKDMTAEIEHVPSVPQQPVNNAGSMKLSKKQSSDTIRPPKREKKRTKRAPTLPNNQAKKSDIFEQKIIDTLEDADSSSEETFVYESNPPDAPVRPRHSRTPSITSMHSDARRATQSDATSNPTGGRRSMKFGSNAHYKDAPTFSDAYNTEGSTTLSSNRDGHHHHHPPSGPSYTGLRGNTRNGPQSVFPEEGGLLANQSNHPKSNHSLRASGHHVSASRTSSRPPTSRPTSPKGYGATLSGNALRSANANHLYSSKRGPQSKFLPYGDDDVDGDNEETPLVNYGVRVVGSAGIGRKRRSGGRQQSQHERRNAFARFAGCLIAVVAILLVVMGAFGFVFMTTKPLDSLVVRNITDVLVSKQEMMFNLVVEAVNPNAMSVQITSMDVNIFAKSPYVRDIPKEGDGDPNEGEPAPKDPGDGGWLNKLLGKGTTATRRKPRRAAPKAVDMTVPVSTSGFRWHRGDDFKWHPSDGVDEGTDPIPDPEDDPSADAQTMLLGRIFQFDAPLIFEGSPIYRQPSLSIGEMRLPKPGNKTEEGGTERWERVMLHTFELIVRGVLRYQLPLSGRVRTTTISASVFVKPDELPQEFWHGRGRESDGH